MNTPASVKRWHPLLGEWVIFAPVTDDRPWSGVTLKPAEEGPSFDPGCYLCPGVKRSSGRQNPAYADVFVFDNDFPSLPPAGICRVVCFSPLHNVTLAEMPVAGVEKVLRIFAAQSEELSQQPGIEYVTMFENKGREIGVSNPHPHGQIYATDFIPRIPAAMYRNAEAHASKSGKCLFCEVLEREIKDGSGMVARNPHFAAYVPHFARFKYEVHIVPFRHVSSLAALTSEETSALAGIYREVLIRYDNLFRMIIPNITVFYNNPCQTGLSAEPWHFHIQFAPHIRSADKLKYLAGFETGGGNIINPGRPGDSAEELRRASVLHYAEETA